MTRFSVTSRERRAEQIYEHGSLPRAHCLVLMLLFDRVRDFSSTRRFFASELGDIAALVFSLAWSLVAFGSCFPITPLNLYRLP
mmetsp:Transcript_30426/g.101105  ORF Transcript_30426/g.101105 Transcript_30426/m.101105 type:complete len:84 (+) Transcript_30426:831-1082(+)